MTASVLRQSLGDLDRDWRDDLVVDALTQARTEFGGVAGAVAQQLVGGAVGCERVGGEDQRQQRGVLRVDGREVDLEEGLRLALGTDADAVTARVEPDLVLAEHDEPRDLLPRRDSEPEGHGRELEALGLGIELLGVVEQDRDRARRVATDREKHASRSAQAECRTRAPRRAACLRLPRSGAAWLPSASQSERFGTLLVMWWDAKRPLLVNPATPVESFALRKPAKRSVAARTSGSDSTDWSCRSA